jgi:hypothetical protein
VADIASVKSPCQGGAVATLTRGRNDDGRMKIKFPGRKTGVRVPRSLLAKPAMAHNTIQDPALTCWANFCRAYSSGGTSRSRKGRGSHVFLVEAPIQLGIRLDLVDVGIGIGIGITRVDEFLSRGVARMKPGFQGHERAGWALVKFEHGPAA